jgi:hypothetical protein
MLVLAILGAALAISLITGGRLRYVQNWQLKGAWLAIATFLVQTVLFTQWGEGIVGENLVPFIYLATLVVLLAFLFVNRHVLGVPILLVGLMLNCLVIAANGGRMPASVTALTKAGRSQEAARLTSNYTAANCVLMGSATNLNVLGDIIVIRLGVQVGSAYSVGDLVALAGEAVVVFGAVRVKLPALTNETGKSEDPSVS